MQTNIKFHTIKLLLLVQLLVLLNIANAGNFYYVDPKMGNDEYNGTLSYPWKTIKHGISKLKPGDTLYLRGGIYTENNIYINVKGNESNRIFIRNYPGEKVIISAIYGQFGKVPNLEWEVYDSEKKVYRSTKNFSPSKGICGFLEINGKLYQLIEYEDFKHLSSNNQFISNDKYVYVGPGLKWEDGRIYIRLQPTNTQLYLGYGITEIDPKKVVLYIYKGYNIFYFTKESSFIDIEGINVKACNKILEFQEGAHHIRVKNFKIFGASGDILVRPYAHDIILDGLIINNSIPPWIAWSDVKEGKKPAHSLQGPAIGIQNFAYNIEIKNSTIYNTWDAIDILEAQHDIYIHDNLFKNIHDDVIQLGSKTYNIFINNNKMFKVGSGISRNGSGSPLIPGTKYIHHNIIDCSRPLLKHRIANNSVKMVWHTPFGWHNANNSADPWKIYNNTIIFGSSYNENDAGQKYDFKSYDPKYPHEVYNNIFIQIADHWILKNARVSDGSQIFDGNLYYRSVSDPKTPIFFGIRKNIKEREIRNFYKLSDFKNSEFFNITKSYYPPGWEAHGIEADPLLDENYYPDPEGPAATGAVDLSSKGWPGADGSKYRGALPPRPEPPQNLYITD